MGEVHEERLQEVSKVKRKGKDRGRSKRAKLETEEGVVLGEEVASENLDKRNFLFGELARSERKTTGQGKMTVFTGVEWLCRDVLKEVANSAVDNSDWAKVAEGWEEWIEDDEIGKSSEREEKFLWGMMDEADKVLDKD